MDYIRCSTPKYPKLKIFRRKRHIFAEKTLGDSRKALPIKPESLPPSLKCIADESYGTTPSSFTEDISTQSLSFVCLPSSISERITLFTISRASSERGLIFFGLVKGTSQRYGVRRCHDYRLVADFCCEIKGCAAILGVKQYIIIAALKREYKLIKFVVCKLFRAFWGRQKRNALI